MGTVVPDRNCVAPKHFRRKAVAHLSTHETETNTLMFPHRQSARLRISLTIADMTITRTAHNSVEVPEHPSLETSLTWAQREIVDEEIFAILIREASSLPTSSARVAERIIIIDVDQGTELRFEMVRLIQSQIILIHRKIGGYQPKSPRSILWTQIPVSNM